MAEDPTPHPAATGEPVPAEANDDISLIELLVALGEEKKIVFGFPVIAATLAAIVSLMLPPLFTAITTFLPPQQQQSVAAAALQQLGGLGGAASGLPGIRRPEDLYIAILRSRTVQGALIDRFELGRRYGLEIRDEVRKALNDNVNIAAARSGLISLEASDRDPDFAAQLANAHVDELRKVLGALAVTEAQQRRAFFEQQLLNAKEALIKAEVALMETQERTGLIDLQKQGETIIKAAAELRAQIASREVQLEATRTFATPRHAEVQRIASEIAGLRAQLAKLEAGQVRGHGEVMVPSGQVPGIGLAYIRALREVKYQEAMFELLARQFELAKVDEAREGPLLQQMDVAIPPERRSKPARKQMVLIGGMAGLGLGILLGLVLYHLRKGRQDPVRAARMSALRKAWVSSRFRRG